MRKDLPFALFPTAVGVCGIAWTARGIRRVELPKTGRRKTMMQLSHGKPAHEQSAPPEWVRAVIRKLTRHLEGAQQDFTRVSIDLNGLPPFHQRTLKEARRIQPGQTVTYGALARQLRSPKAARAVGQALANNPVPIIVPCHRVLAAGGKLGGFSAAGGVTMKARLLAIEKRDRPLF
ncbi:MAG: methylated-DNA--[protein]-cysteine S-methyltransferase [Deltaproteobacteria bacterium]|nr:methylated-DNA--[protein]-cysteine S-methyltransferase [Deltaproteobacteria bacterium]